MSPTLKKKANSATLARVRDNQRRCRARKREYVIELERKIQDLQAAGAQANIENHRNIVQRLEAENRKLRQLLNRAGVSQTRVDAQLREGSDTWDMGHSLNATDGQSFPCAAENANDYREAAPDEASIGLMPDIYGTSPPAVTPAVTFNDLLNTPSLELPEGEFDMFNLAQPMQSIGLRPISPKLDGTSQAFPFASLLSENQPACPSPVRPTTPRDLSRLNTAKPDSDTTLCSVAYDLVRQHNKKGVDMIEIGIRLWNGFIQSDQDNEGCRVENKLLFSVLEYISG